MIKIIALDKSKKSLPSEVESCSHSKRQLLGDANQQKL